MGGFILLTVLLLSGYKISSTEAIAPGDTCVTNGALAASQFNNNQFYYCLNGIVYLGSCTNGRYFDSNTAQCVYSGSNNPGQINCYGNNYATFPYAYDNTRYYYCLNNQAIIIQCPINYYYNPYAYTCTAAIISGASQCSIGVNALIPDPNNCRNYVLCQNGQAFNQVCPMGLYFQESGTCGPTPRPNCGDGGGTGGNGGTCTSQQEKQLAPNTGNCGGYYQCVNGTWISFLCPSNYYFNKNTLTCGPSYSGSCSNNYNDNNNYYPMMPNYPNYPTYPSYPIYNPSYPIYNPINIGGGICSGLQNGVMADTSNCQRYYYCVNGSPYSMACPNGYYFNPVIGNCGSNIPVTCSGSIIEEKAVVCPANAEVTLADPNDCKAYIMCTNGLGTSLSCGPGLYYSVEENSCTAMMPTRCF